MKVLILLFAFLPVIVIGQEDGEPESIDELTAITEETEGSDLAQSESEEANDQASENDSTSNQEPLPRVQPQPSLRRIREVVNHLGLFSRDEEVIKFSDDEASISGLYLPENTGKPQGGILILHDIDQHAHWPNTIGPLREYLPDYGWNTLSLFFDGYIKPPLPMIPSEENPEEDASIAPVSEELADTESPLDPIDDPLGSEEMEDAVDEDAIDENFDTGAEPSDELGEIAADFQPFSIPDESNPVADEEESPSSEENFIEAMTERVEGGLRQLNTLGQFNLVVVAHGLSANWAANTLKRRFEQNPGIKGYALVLIDAQQSAYPKFDLNNTVAQFQIPVLDIYTSQDEHQERIAKRRKDSIVREQKADYWQIKLPSIHHSSNKNQTMITRRVRGWLKTHAAGEEVNVAEKRY